MSRSPTLWLPYGLYAQHLCQVVGPAPRRRSSSGKQKKAERAEQEAIDRIDRTPMALLPREPSPGSYYFEVRPALEYPKDQIVERVVFSAPANGLVKVRLDVDTSGAPKFVCDPFEIRLLRLFSNVDILARARDFLAAVVPLLKLTWTTGPKNLEVVYDMMRWWWNPENPENRVELPLANTFQPWISREFEDRQSRIYAGLKIENPWCFASLVRELLYDPELTSRIISAQPTVPDKRDLVESALGDVAYPIFRNADAWITKTMDEAKRTGKPNWFGCAQDQALGRADRQLERQAGRRSKAQLPLKPGRELLNKVDATRSFASIELATAAYPDPTAKEMGSYYNAKKTFARARYYLVATSLAGGLCAAPGPDDLPRGTMALLRAIDELVLNKVRHPTATWPRLDTLVQRHVEEHLRPGFDWESKHPWDREILDSLVLHGSSKRAKPEPAIDASIRKVLRGNLHEGLDCPKDPVDPVDLLARYVNRDLLDQLMTDARLSADERAAILFKFGLGERPAGKTDQKLTVLQCRALEKLRRLRGGSDPDHL